MVSDTSTPRYMFFRGRTASIAIFSIAVLWIGIAPLSAGAGIVDFESLNQTEIFNGSGWNGRDTADVLDTFASSGVVFSAGVSGINIDNLGLPNGTGRNGVINSIRSGLDDTPTLIFSISAVGGEWREVSFDYLHVSDITVTAYDSDGNVLNSDVLPRPLLLWQPFTVTTDGNYIAKIDFISDIGSDVIIDNLDLTKAVPEPTSLAVLGLGGICLLVHRRRRSRADRPATA